MVENMVSDYLKADRGIWIPGKFQREGQSCLLQWDHTRLCVCLCVQVHTLEALDKWTPQIGGENVFLHVYSPYGWIDPHVHT